MTHVKHKEFFKEHVAQVPFRSIISMVFCLFVITIVYYFNISVTRTAEFRGKQLVYIYIDKTASI